MFKPFFLTGASQEETRITSKDRCVVKGAGVLKKKGWTGDENEYEAEDEAKKKKVRGAGNRNIKRVILDSGYNT